MNVAKSNKVDWRAETQKAAWLSFVVTQSWRQHSELRTRQALGPRTKGKGLIQETSLRKQQPACWQMGQEWVWVLGKAISIESEVVWDPLKTLVLIQVYYYHCLFISSPLLCLYFLLPTHTSPEWFTYDFTHKQHKYFNHHLTGLIAFCSFWVRGKVSSFSRRP